MRAFLDTVGLLALWNRNDQWHTTAKAAYLALPGNTIFVTTTFVLMECGNAASRLPFRDDVDDFRSDLEALGRLIHYRKSDWQAAWENYRKGFASSAGIVDQVSFVVMRRLKITRAFTNDQHFRAAGFIPLF
jgi:predicted nucleic acid-binding protein